jgi:predicted lactoylglutathione lyase
MTAMFVNLPVTDLERAKAFYTAIGFTINPQSPTTTRRALSSKKTTATS